MTEAASTAPARPGRRPDDRLAGLVEQRDFLLRSLDDLEREHRAGDVDDHDYEVLRDDYTARAADAIRSIEDAASRQAPEPATGRRRGWRRPLATALGVVAFAVVAGVLVAQASGRRQAGDALTGDIRQSTRTQLAEAVQLAGKGDVDGAVEIYDDVLAGDPDNVEALTYKGWVQFLDGDSAGIDSLVAATRADPTYPATHAFLAVILDRAGRPEAALAELERLDALDPPPDILRFVASMRERLEAQVGGAGAGSSGATGAPRASGSSPPPAG